MAYVTKISDQLIDLDDLDAGVLDLGSLSILNFNDTSIPFSTYDIDEFESAGATLEHGESITLLDGDGDPVLSGIGGGTATLSQASVTIGIPFVASLTITVNPLSGFLMNGPDGTYFISENPIDDAHISLNITGTIGLTSVNLVNLSLGALDDTPILAPVLNAIQSALNTVVTTINYNPAGEYPVGDTPVAVCFTAGVLIECEGGAVPVELLRPGDRVVTRDHGLQPVRWACTRRLRLDATNDGSSGGLDLRPVRIRAGALGAGVPAADLVVSPQHRILLRSKIATRMFGIEEVLVPARHLLAVRGVEVVEGLTEVTYVHFLLDRHEVVVSNGAETESLHIGPQARKMVGAAAMAEICAIFPELDDPAVCGSMARMVPSGRRAKRLAERHAKSGQPPVCRSAPLL